jgi:uncharacterized protein
VRITLEELRLHRIVVSKTYSPDELDCQGAEFRQSDTLKVDAVAELTGAEIRIHGHIATRLEATCDRCLGPVEIPVERDFDLAYRPIGSIARQEEIEISRAELEVGFYSGNGIELADVVTEQVILAVPMKVICGADCRGLCPICGANRNLESCNCPEAPADSPFASLE